MSATAAAAKVAAAGAAAAHYDAVVVGLGGVGSMALRALSRHGGGGRFLGLDACSADRAGFSSRGRSRIYRRAYFEHPDYVPWIDFSLRTVREMEASSGMSLHRACGALVLEPTQTQQQASARIAALHNLPPTLRAAWEAAERHGVPVEYLAPRDLPDRFPQFNHRRRTVAGVHEPGAGLVRPERILRQALAEATGGSGSAHSSAVETLYETRVAKLTQLGREAGSSRARIELQLRQQPSTGETLVVTTDHLLVSLGGWTGTLLPSWGKILTPIRQLQGWVDVSSRNINENDTTNVYRAGSMPSFVYKDPSMEHPLYGVPADDESDAFDDDDDELAGDGTAAAAAAVGDIRNCIKIGTHKYTGERALPAAHGSSDDCDSGDPIFYPPPARPDEIRALEAAIPFALDRRAWTGGGGGAPSGAPPPTLAAAKSCLYTVSPDRQFVIGVPAAAAPHNNVFAVAGLSGHGYKMTPALGQMMADFALGVNVREKWQTGFCDPSRFGV